MFAILDAWQRELAQERRFGVWCGLAFGMVVGFWLCRFWDWSGREK